MGGSAKSLPGSREGLSGSRSLGEQSKCSKLPVGHRPHEGGLPLSLRALALACIGVSGVLLIRALRRLREQQPSRNQKSAQANQQAVVPDAQAARLRQLAAMGARVGSKTALNRAQRIFASAERKEALDRELELVSAQEVARTLGEMKGVLMKLGQLASFIDDAMPENVRQTLAQLQQNAPPMSGELAASVIAEELGAPPEKLFQLWDPEPIAAASIGQVHRAITKDGTAVAVKVQYPGIAEAMEADLKSADLAGMLAPMLFKGLDVNQMAEELRARLTEELDYSLEATRQQRFANFYEGHPTIKVPRVIEALSTSRVLTSELVSGARFEELETWGQTERDLAAETIYRFAFGSIYRMRAFNGDPHPGNYLFQPGGKVIFLDFGLVKEFTDEDYANMLLMIDSCVINREPTRVRRTCEQLGLFLPGAPVSDEAIDDFMALFFDIVRRDEPATITPEWAAEVSRRLLAGRATHSDVVKWANMPAPYLILQRINVGLFALFGRLNATGNWRAISEEIWPNVLRAPSTPMGRAEQRWLAEKHPHLGRAARN